MILERAIEIGRIIDEYEGDTTNRSSGRFALAIYPRQQGELARELGVSDAEFLEFCGEWREAFLHGLEIDDAGNPVDPYEGFTVGDVATATAVDRD